jgi:hypothetical protein
VRLRERFGRHQLFALLLLFAFLAEAFWLIHVRPLTRLEVAYVRAGFAQFHGEFLDPGVTPVPPALAVLPEILSGHPLESIPPDHLKWMVRLPFVAFGWLLGASIWYVTRRLYGNAGGYLALALYCFSPMLMFCFPGPTIVTSLGAFGMVFVSVAAAHTLYAPAETAEADHALLALFDIRHRWRRMVLLGLAIALGVGSTYWLVFLLILTEAFMVYIVPERQFAAVGLVLAACAFAFVVLWALHGFHWHMYWTSLTHARWLPLDPRTMAGPMLRTFLRGMTRTGNPALLGLSLMALAAYVAYPRSRYFGNTAPLLALLFMMVFALISMSDLYTGPFPMRGLPFLFVFIAGVFADLVETEWRTRVLLFTLVMLGVYVATALLELSRARVSVLY